MDAAPLRRLVALALLLAALPAAAVAGGTEELRDQLLAELAARRLALGLDQLAALPALQAAAQAHAEELAAAGTLRFTSPAGLSVEQRVSDAGVRAGLVAAKVYRASALYDGAQLAASWWNEVGPSRNSVLHSGVTAVGLGIAEGDGERFFSFLLTRPASALAAVESSDDLLPLRQLFLVALNDQRDERRLPALRLDPVCERAAQRHAEDLLAALRAGKAPPAASRLADLVHEQRRLGAGDPVSGGSTLMQRSTTSASLRSSLRGAIGQAVVVDATDPEQALETALRGNAGALVDPGFLRLGVGIALDPGGPAPHAVWVACLARR